MKLLLSTWTGLNRICRGGLNSAFMFKLNGWVEKVVRHASFSERCSINSPKSTEDSIRLFSIRWVAVYKVVVWAGERRMNDRKCTVTEELVVIVFLLKLSFSAPLN